MIMKDYAAQATISFQNKATTWTFWIDKNLSNAMRSLNILGFSN